MFEKTELWIILVILAALSFTLYNIYKYGLIGTIQRGAQRKQEQIINKRKFLISSSGSNQL